MYPFNAHAIDVSKIINNESDESMDNTKNKDLESDSNSLTVVENLLSKDQLGAFIINTNF